MSTTDFFSSLPGMYVAQSFCHSLVASVIMDQALRAWKIENPAVRQRFRLVVVLFPVFSFPLYQLISPDRGSVLFRLTALFDTTRWLNVELWGIFPLGVLFLSVLAITSLIFLLQEMVPVIRHSLEARVVEHEGALRGPDPFLADASRALGIAAPEVYVVEDEDLVIFSSTGKNPAIYLSTGIERSLTPEELESALAHELAHIARSRRPLILAVFFLRMILFFNPVALIEFRRVVRNEEKICDDIAVSLTRHPEALAAALKKFFVPQAAPEPETGRKPLIAPVRLEEYSYNIQLDGRVARLEQGKTNSPGGRWFPLLLAVLVIAGISYYVV